MRLSQSSTSGGLNSMRRTSLRRFIRERKSPLRLTLIFLVLIFVPSGLLGYLSWRAIENEKLLSRQKIIEGYQQFVRLAAGEIDHELESVQARLQTSVEASLDRMHRESANRQLDSLIKAEPLILSCTLLRDPGEIVDARAQSLPRAGVSSTMALAEVLAREYDLYVELAADGEELEYRATDLAGAIAVYQRILAETSSPQLHAMAYRLIGRAQTKKGDWQSALFTYEKLLQDYPEVRDLNRMYLRFLAQYQIAVCLRHLNRSQEAITALVRMNKDLLERSDTMNLLQYSHFRNWIETLLPEILASPRLAGVESYRQQFQALSAQSKKRISDKYFVQFFDEELRKLIVERKPYRSTIRYSSGQADNEPFLLGFLHLPDQSGSHISGLLGFRVDLMRLREVIFPATLSRLKTSEAVILAILDNSGSYVIGTTKPNAAPLATLALDSPFKFWQVGVFLDNDEPVSTSFNFSTILWPWLISLLLLSIFWGAYVFLRYARHEAHLSELKSTFVSRVSHELRTPLTSIKMLSEHLAVQLRQTTSTPERDLQARAEQYVNVICRESDRLGRLIENILDFSRIERGVKQYTFEYEMPAVVVHKAIDSFRPHAEAQGFSVKTHIDDALPELFIDADAITQAILNLLSNAVKYSEKEKSIEVRAFQDRDAVCIEVEDRGIGISADQLTSIFDEFYRVDQKLSSKRQDGVGLGLTLVKHIVQAHGGTIRVRSQEGKGSTFVITVPVPENAGTQATAPAERSKQKLNQSIEIVP